MGYNPSFKLNPEQLDMIETALRAEMGRLTRPAQKNWNEVCPKKETATKINELLGHLHNQKAWYNPEDSIPLG